MRGLHDDARALARALHERCRSDMLNTTWLLREACAIGVADDEIPMHLSGRACNPKLNKIVLKERSLIEPSLWNFSSVHYCQRLTRRTSITSTMAVLVAQSREHTTLPAYKQVDETTYDRKSEHNLKEFQI
jgi:hypothetical protein